MSAPYNRPNGWADPDKTWHAGSVSVEVTIKVNVNGLCDSENTHRLLTLRQTQYTWCTERDKRDKRCQDGQSSGKCHRRENWGWTCRFTLSRWRILPTTSDPLFCQSCSYMQNTSISSYVNNLLTTAVKWSISLIALIARLIFFNHVLIAVLTHILLVTFSISLCCICS